VAVRRRKPERPQVDNTMVMYTSLVLILLTFFIMLTAKANFNETKYGLVVESVYDTFGIMTGGLSAIGSESGLAMDKPSIGDPSVRVSVRDTEMARIRAILAPETLDDRARIVHNRGQRIISISSSVIFEGDSSDLSGPGLEALLAISRILKDSAVKIAVEGHTDNLPPGTEGAGDNWEISMDRALAVMGLMSGDGGIPADRLSAYGYAGNKPIVANNSPKNRSRNNRVDLVLDFDSARIGALRAFTGEERLFDYGGFEFVLPVEPGSEDEVY
jgi:chemotaxis protein MotB